MGLSYDQKVGLAAQRRVCAINQRHEWGAWYRSGPRQLVRHCGCGASQRRPCTEQVNEGERCTECGCLHPPGATKSAPISYYPPGTPVE